MTINIVDFENYSATKLLKSLDLYKIPVDLDAVCEKLGVKTSHRFKFNSHSGEISVDEDKKVKIWINPTDHENRQRFTFAHEIGHLIYDIIPYLKSSDGDSEFIDTPDTLRRDGRQHPKEYRANDFAAKLLMPEKLVVEHGKELLATLKTELCKKKVPKEIFIERMASKFKVSQQAMKIRLEVIGIL
ncbi:ImmA/IrrE family metallo-endopeptidase [Pseudoalteromonas sp. T1lg24]|uniref:ImmA/IrrE family metallo-endopeptidase n=1 Tax=Pseudoalteromonas sp. T1lg24 TaxID=2077099 RepID=UPI000CF6098C|nr:ImmA/IrrE family metallo-endopeptidase [Pseudoalteromonas sp. T1lg24]